MLSNIRIRLCNSLLSSLRNNYIGSCSYIHHSINTNNVNKDCNTSSHAVKYNNLELNGTIKGYSLIVTRGYASGKLPGVDIEEIKDLPNHPEKLLIDVREPLELKRTGAIPTSINIPLGQLETELQLDPTEFKTKYGRDKPNALTEIIFYCRIGERSEQATAFAARVGFQKTKNYLGSWNEWADKHKLPK